MWTNRLEVAKKTKKTLNFKFTMIATIIVILIRGYLNPERQTPVKLSARTSTLYPKAILDINRGIFMTLIWRLTARR